jgi:hypothetical protein
MPNSTTATVTPKLRGPELILKKSEMQARDQEYLEKGAAEDVELTVGRR